MSSRAHRDRVGRAADFDCGFNSKRDQIQHHNGAGIPASDECVPAVAGQSNSEWCPSHFNALRHRSTADIHSQHLTAAEGGYICHLAVRAQRREVRVLADFPHTIRLGRKSRPAGQYGQQKHACACPNRG